MISTLAVHGYRSLRDLVVPLAPVTVVTGENGAGKSSLYRALRLLSASAHDGLIAPLAHEGGLAGVLWAGPERISSAMARGEVPVEGTVRGGPISLMLGFADASFGYLIDVGLPSPSAETAFGRDPAIKREEIFAAPILRPAARLVRRKNDTVTLSGDAARRIPARLTPRQSLLAELADEEHHPEIAWARRTVRGWRFYDGFRTDADSPTRSGCIGTWTPVLAEDGHDLPAAVQTILESAWAQPFKETVDEAFPGSEVRVAAGSDGRFMLEMVQPGMLRPLGAAELSDGTLRLLCAITVLLSPHPPDLLVLNEPETSLHPHVLPILARLIHDVARRVQVVIVSHSTSLIEPLREAGGDDVGHRHLVKKLGETHVDGQGLLSRPQWEWGKR